MFTSLILSLTLATPLGPVVQSAATGGSSEPPIRLSLNSDGQYRPGDRARVHVRSEEDGYLIVLRTDVDGWVRVLYPADPFDDDFVRGGKEFEIRDRGDREAFAVSRRDGSGVVLAAFSTRPFDFQQFVRNDHWDYRVLDSLRSDSDPEAALLSMVDAMAGGGTNFEYDVMTYTVSDGRNDYQTYSSASYYPSYYYPSSYYPSYYYPSCWGCYRGGWSISFGIGWYRPYRSYYRSAFYYDPFYSSCWGFCYSRSYSWYRGGYYRPWSRSYVYASFGNSWGRGYSWGRSGFGSRSGYGSRPAGGRVTPAGYREPRYAQPRQAAVESRSFSRASLGSTRPAAEVNVGQRRTLDARGAVQRDARMVDRSGVVRRDLSGADRPTIFRRDVSSDRSAVVRRDLPSGARTLGPSEGASQSRRSVQGDARVAQPSGRFVESPRASREPSRSGASEGRSRGGAGSRVPSGGGGYSGGGRASSGGGGRSVSSGGGGRVSSGGGYSGGGGRAPSGGGGEGSGRRR